MVTRQHRARLGLSNHYACYIYKTRAQTSLSPSLAVMLFYIFAIKHGLGLDHDHHSRQSIALVLLIKNSTYTLNTKQKHKKTAQANKMPFMTSEQETEWALFLQPWSPHAVFRLIHYTCRQMTGIHQLVLMY